MLTPEMSTMFEPVLNNHTKDCLYLSERNFCLSLDIFNQFRCVSCAFISVTKSEVCVGSPGK